MANFIVHRAISIPRAVDILKILLWDCKDCLQKAILQLHMQIGVAHCIAPAIHCQFFVTPGLITQSTNIFNTRVIQT